MSNHRRVWLETMQSQREAARIERAVARRSSRIGTDVLLRVADAHARAEAIEACGGWARVAASLPLIQQTADGELRDGGDMGVRVLVVRCPSTGRTYGLRVPTTVRSVAGALKFVNGVPQRAIVAHA